jgi:hypothetical protein
MKTLFITIFMLFFLFFLMFFLAGFFLILKTYFDKKFLQHMFNTGIGRKDSPIMVLHYNNKNIFSQVSLICLRIK